MQKNLELIAAYFTIGGDVYPGAPSEVSPFSFAHRVQAAAEAGYKGVGLVHNDLMAVADKLGYKQMRQILNEFGMKYFEIEILEHWYRSGEIRRQSDKIRAEMLEVAAEVGVSTIKLGSGPADDPLNIELMTENFAKIADQAAVSDTAVMIEFMPFCNLNTLAPAIEIAQNANRKNAGILLDIWHVARANIDFNDIRSIPQHLIKGIELDDANRYPLENLFLDTIHKRQLPGDGDLDLALFIDAVKSTGFAGPWGVEVISEVHRKKPLQQMAQESFEKTIRYFQ
ncbi:sugar phosphate isomerase/epimerase family protein [Acinetobacter shaoyimingii]|uniref:Sugar phosphate isomerase/epimerase n=1 Tax=Acinetobacter shaoyimingii TaxID=2715164 RepID=A0A6G8RWY8_9GAMM|nr:sugar phosphate isomerase/epimerase [Acinetobacter shaoyimingii]QIO06456.1 sugar phosphate isomerase/epimerase [Acinetobacter shaoyimingii]